MAVIWRRRGGQRLVSPAGSDIEELATMDNAHAHADQPAHNVNRDGSVIAVIHQYDRHPELRRLFAAKALPSPWRRAGLDAVHRWKGRALRLKARLSGDR